MDTPMMAETIDDHRSPATRSRRTSRARLAPGPHPGRRRDPPHARLRPLDQGDRAHVRGVRLRGAVPEPALPVRARRQGDRRRRGRDRSGRCARRPVHRRRAAARPTTCARCPTSNGKVGVIGYCSGGRQAYVVACSLDIDAAVDCYGGRVVADARRPHAGAADLADRPHARSALPAARTVRRRRRQPVARADREDRGSAAGERQDLRVPHLRGRGPRVLLRRPPATTASRRPRRVGSSSGTSSGAT